VPPQEFLPTLAARAAEAVSIPTQARAINMMSVVLVRLFMALLLIDSSIRDQARSVPGSVTICTCYLRFVRAFLRLIALLVEDGFGCSMADLIAGFIVIAGAFADRGVEIVAELITGIGPIARLRANGCGNAGGIADFVTSVGALTGFIADRNRPDTADIIAGIVATCTRAITDNSRAAVVVGGVFTGCV